MKLSATQTPPAASTATLRGRPHRDPGRPVWSHPVPASKKHLASAALPPGPQTCTSWLFPSATPQPQASTNSPSESKRSMRKLSTVGDEEIAADPVHRQRQPDYRPGRAAAGPAIVTGAACAVPRTPAPSQGRTQNFRQPDARTCFIPYPTPSLSVPYPARAPGEPRMLPGRRYSRRSPWVFQVCSPRNPFDSAPPGARGAAPEAAPRASLPTRVSAGSIL